MREFAPMAHGTHGWDEQYNNDVGLLFGEMADAKANGVMNLYTHSKIGTAHAVTGEGVVMRFFATAPWAAGDTIAVNGEAVNPITLDGAALPAGGFVSGMWVVAVKDGKNLQFLTQSYAGVFADINSQLSNKAQTIAGKLDPSLLYRGLISDANEATVPGIYWIKPDSTNTPRNGGYGILEVKTREGHAYETEWIPTGGAWIWQELRYVAGHTANDKSVCETIYLRNTSGDLKWSEWTALATVEPPQEYDLPLSSGFINRSASLYSKDQFGRVFIRIAVQTISDSAAIQGTITIANLPEGYRPKTGVVAPAFADGSGGGANVLVRPSGEILVYSSENSSFVHSQITYLTI